MPLFSPYCHALYSALLKKTIDRLQLVKNSVARTLTRTRESDYITQVLASLDWLTVSTLRIDLEILLLILKVQNGLAPSVLLVCFKAFTEVA